MSRSQMVKVRDVSLYTRVIGHGHPIAVMHGGPSADHTTMLDLRDLADEFTLVLYDHRCNGRSVGPPVSSMTWENLTADADALREHFGYERWTVLGHSFGGHVALEYALRYPDRVSGLVLLDSGADANWSRENAARVLAERGYKPEKVELVRRWFKGEFEPREYFSIFWAIGDAYMHNKSMWPLLSDLVHGGWRWRPRPEAMIYAGRQLMAGWTVVERLGEIHAPTLVIAGRDDFVFPPECQRQLADGIGGSQLRIVDAAGHNPQIEQRAEVISAIRRFLQAASLSGDTAGLKEALFAGGQSGC